MAKIKDDDIEDLRESFHKIDELGIEVGAIIQGIKDRGEKGKGKEMKEKIEDLKKRKEDLIKRLEKIKKECIDEIENLIMRARNV